MRTYEEAVKARDAAYVRYRKAADRGYQRGRGSYTNVADLCRIDERIRGLKARYEALAVIARAVGNMRAV